MIKYYDKQEQRLVFVGQASCSEFWDSHWEVECLTQDITLNADPSVLKTTQAYLEQGSRILEGGCGRGGNVQLLQRSGYDTYGVDYAAKTVARINECAPDLKVAVGDVRDLDFPDNCFDGYWSIGVIEHFQDGYGIALEEMSRVIRAGGFLFLSVPVMSSLRRWKARHGRYPEWTDDPASRGQFYQYALDPRRLAGDCERRGLTLVDSTLHGAVKGLKSEVRMLRALFQRVYESESFVARVCRRGLEFLCASFAAHTVLLVLQKRPVRERAE